MKRKLIALVMIFIFSFGLISNTREKKTEAFVGGLIATYGAAKIIGMLVGGGALIATGVGIQNPFDETDNAEWVDFLKEQMGMLIRDYRTPQEPEPPHQLNNTEMAALNSLLTQQGIEVGTDIYDLIYDNLYENSGDYYLPGDDSIIGTELFLSQLGSNIGLFIPGSYMINLSAYDNAYSQGTYDTVYEWKPEFLNTYKKINFVNGALQNDYVWLHFTTETVTTGGTWRSHRAVARIISSDNSAVSFPFYNNTAITPNGDLVGGQSNFDTHFGTVTFTGEYEEPLPDIPKMVVLPDIKPDKEAYTPKFYNYDLSPLSGLVSSTDEMLGIVNGTIQVSPQRQQEIDRAWQQVLLNYLDNPNFEGNNETPKAPTINPTTGLLDYEDLPEQPQTDPDDSPDELSALQKVIYWLKGIWYGIRDLPKNIGLEIGKLFTTLNNWLGEFWTKIDTLIDDFWMSFTDWWQDNFIVHWTAFIDWLNTLPGLISGAFTGLFDLLLIPLNALVSLLQNIWDWLLGLPDLIRDWFVPEQPDIADIWEPFIILWHDKIDPIKAPFENIGFYATEYEDVTVDLQFHNVGGTFKILDYQYVKDYREPVKNILRSFFWILIIFFNLDQVHRLIRNQSIIKTYVRKVEQPGGKD